MATIEEYFLNKAKDDALKLRVTLSNGEKVNGMVSEFSKYDVSITTDTGAMSLSKKDVTSLSYATPVIQPPETSAAAPGAQSRSRIQDEFLDKYIREKTLALFTMMSGGTLRGVVTAYDGFTILAKTGQGQLLAYKHGLLGVGPGYRRDSAR